LSSLLFALILLEPFIITRSPVRCDAIVTWNDGAIFMQAKEEGKEAADAVEPVMRTVSKSSEEWQVQNDSKPLWTRSPREVSRV